jgi:hypothetical protein
MKVRMSFRFDETDVKTWKRHAMTVGMTLSEWVRRRLNEVGDETGTVGSNPTSVRGALQADTVIQRDGAKSQPLKGERRLNEVEKVQVRQRLKDSVDIVGPEKAERRYEDE